MIKVISTNKKELKCEGKLNDIDEVGFHIEDKDGKVDVLKFEEILKLFEYKNFKLSFIEQSKDEEDISVNK